MHCNNLFFRVVTEGNNLVTAQEATEAAEAVAAKKDEGIIMDGLTAEDEKALNDSKESFVFQAEVNRLMDIIINSLCKCCISMKISM